MGTSASVDVIGKGTVGKYLIYNSLFDDKLDALAKYVSDNKVADPVTCGDFTIHYLEGGPIAVGNFPKADYQAAIFLPSNHPSFGELEKLSRGEKLD